MKKTALIFAATLVSFLFAAPAAFAINDDVSEYNHHAGAGQLEIAPQVGETWDTVNRRDPGSGNPNVDHFSNTATNADVAADYGLTRYLSLGATLGFSTNFTEYVGGTDDGHGYNSDGFNDILFFAHGHTKLGPGSIVYRFDLDTSVGDSVRDTHGDYNEQSGGWYVRSRIGYELNLDGDTAGIDVSYLHRGTRKLQFQYATHSPYDESVRGGDNLGASIFYEHVLDKPLLAGVVFYFERNQADRYDQVGQQNEGNDYELEAYVRWRLTKLFEVIPHFDFITRNFTNDNYPDTSSTTYEFLVTGRFSLWM